MDTVKKIYASIKWQASRIWSFHRLKVQIAIALFFLIGIVLWTFVFFAPYKGPASEWVSLALVLGLIFNLAGLATFIASGWSTFHFGRRHKSIQCTVHAAGRLSIHWSPRPTWLRTKQSRAPRIPYRELFEETATWIAASKQHGFHHVELNSPLCIKQSKNGPIHLRPVWTQIMNALALHVSAADLDFLAPAPMGAFKSRFYGFWWPGLQRINFPGCPNRLATGGYEIHIER
jgi:hypothetical protein